MGELVRQPAGLLMKSYGLDVFAETGMGPHARGLKTAIRLPFKRIYSVELLPEVLAQGMSQVDDPRVEAIQGDSADAVPHILEQRRGGERFLWWLDAHFPAHYDGTIPEDSDPTPLVQEVRAIVEDGRHQRDVILMDDWRMFGGDRWGAGRLPDNARGVFPVDPRHAQEITQLLEITHDLVLDTRDGGYLLALPKGEKFPQVQKAVASYCRP